MISHVKYVTNGIQYSEKFCVKTWVHLDLWPDNMLFGRLQPKGDPTFKKIYYALM